MNKTISLAAITLVAVVMGIGAIAPAAMAIPNSEHNPREFVCHFDLDPDSDELTDDAAWVVKSVNKHAKVAHMGHGDEAADTDDAKFWCVENNNGSTVDPDVD